MPRIQFGLDRLLEESWLSFDGTRFTGTPPSGFSGAIDIEVFASDGLLSASDIFLLTVAQVGIRMGLIDRTTAAALIAAGIVSVLLFPPLALQLLKPVGDPPDGGSAAAIDE